MVILRINTIENNWQLSSYKGKCSVPPVFVCFLVVFCFLFHLFSAIIFSGSIQSKMIYTVVPTKSDSDVIFCLQ